jgi:alpha-L-fucosidase 2
MEEFKIDPVIQAGFEALSLFIILNVGGFSDGKKTVCYFFCNCLYYYYHLKQLCRGIFHRTGRATGPQACALVQNPCDKLDDIALPIGNGRLGGMVFGGVAQEHIQFNEKTLWTGNTTSLGNYQNFGDLYLNFSGLTSVSNYRRELDIEEAISRVTYTVGSTQYTREYFVSYPDNVMVLRLSSNTTGSLTFDVSMTNAHAGTTTYSGNNITMAGNLDLLSYEAQIQILNEGGSITTGSNKISVSNANAVTILLAGGTDYDASKPTYKEQRLIRQSAAR